MTPADRSRWVVVDVVQDGQTRLPWSWITTFCYNLDVDLAGMNRYCEHASRELHCLGVLNTVMTFVP